MEKQEGKPKSKIKPKLDNQNPKFWKVELKDILSIIGLLVTIIALIYTINHSNKLYKDSISQRNEDKNEARIKDSIITKQRFKVDSENNVRFVEQQKRNKKQDSINDGQLSAIKTQAKIATEQYKFQIKANNQKEFENRAIFDVLKASYDDVNLLGIYYIKNYGKLPVNTTHVVFFIYNKDNDQYLNVERESQIQIASGLSLVISAKIDRETFYSPKTLYYLKINYVDEVNGITKSYFRLFRKEFYNSDYIFPGLNKEEIEMLSNVAFLHEKIKI
nr:hypothetical protein [Pseudopedobacter sp.]